MLYDLIVIGGGPGGYVSAIRAAQLGKKVAVIEKNEIGGTCLNRGCIPTKTLIASAEVFHTVKTADQFGVVVNPPTIDWLKVQERKNKIVKQLREGIKIIFKSYRIELVQGKASFISRSEVEVDYESKKSKLMGTKFVIATGSVPTQVPNLISDGKTVVTSNELLEINEIPKRLLIVGGGVIGIEFACLFNCLGSEVTVVEMLPQILPTEDKEIAELMRQYLTKDGIKIKISSKVTGLEKNKDDVKVTIDGEKKETVIVDKVLVAVGRMPYVEGLNLDKVGVKTGKNRILVNNRMETNIAGIYAVGDATGNASIRKPLLAYVSAMEGIVSAENACGRDTVIDYRVIPNCIYSMPEVASVGLSESAAKEKGYEVSIGKFPFAANGRAIILGNTRGVVKVVTDKKTNEILGVHIIGSHSTELIYSGVLGMKLESVPEEYTRIMFGHPTLSEAVLEAMHDVYKEAIDMPLKNKK